MADELIATIPETEEEDTYIFKLPKRLSLVEDNDPILHTKCERFDFANPPFNIVRFSIMLVEKMQEYKALGLAANQVGVPYRIFAMNTYPALVMINPKLVSASDEQVTIAEGCLSYPGLSIKMKRSSSIEVRVNHPDASAKTYKFENLTAHCFLHELDHLDGKTFIDAADKFHKEKALKDLKNLKRKR